MDETQLNPVAGMMIDSWFATATFRAEFADEYDLPPTLATKAHFMRSVIQAKIKDHSRYTLHPSYAEFGRVQFTDLELGQEFLLRSQSAVTIEHGKFHPQLFDSSEL